MLSGGLDSSAIAGLAASHLAHRGEQLRTFSVGFCANGGRAVPGLPEADSPYAKEVADRVGADHTEVTLASGVMSHPEVRPRTVRARDLPVGYGDMEASMLLLFREARRFLTVVLSGEALLRA